MIRRLSHFLLCLAIALLVVKPAFSASSDIQINTARIEYSGKTYKLFTSFSMDFNHSLEETLLHGIPLYFKTEIEIIRPRAFWFDDVPVSKSRTTRISYNVIDASIHAFPFREPCSGITVPWRMPCPLSGIHHAGPSPTARTLKQVKNMMLASG